MIFTTERSEYWLVGGIPTPPKNDGLRQLGWWLFPTEWENNPAMFQTTNLLEMLSCFQGMDRSVAKSHPILHESLTLNWLEKGKSTGHHG